MPHEAQQVGAWWRDHPAYFPLIETFKGRTSAPHHLAFLVLTGLESRGFEVKAKD